jgi:hypothetical protein
VGPVMLHIVMKPNASIPAHLHKGMAEALYVVEGDFTNEGKQYQAGTSLHFKARCNNAPRLPSAISPSPFSTWRNPSLDDSKSWVCNQFVVWYLFIGVY